MTQARPRRRGRAAPHRLRCVVVPALLWCLAGALLLASRHPRLAALVHTQRRRFGFAAEPPVPRMPPAPALAPLAPRVACLGPRRKLLSRSRDDDLRPDTLPGVGTAPPLPPLLSLPGVAPAKPCFRPLTPSRASEYPVPFLGSQRQLGLDATWMTADGRYGPYGFGQHSPNYSRSRVDWDRLDWGVLQDDCLRRNDARFPPSPPTTRLASAPRFTLKNKTSLPRPTMAWHDFNATRRTALVLRAYANYDYKPEDLWNIRALVVEAALRTGGEYAVFLLVHVRDRDRNVFESLASYDAAFEAAAIPPELRSIAILWDDHLLESWYEAVDEHR